MSGVNTMRARGGPPLSRFSVLLLLNSPEVWECLPHQFDPEWDEPEEPTQWELTLAALPNERNDR